mmetsp:Transcript_66232/g.132917  ORF Transcript_66232/g.132917 Transcript_66232/m.132917 type:complete len:143 (+) Transcript_66232:65-493(+)
MSKSGVVNTWVEERGYGFISPTDSKLGDLFVHVDGIADRNLKKLTRGDRVVFDVEMNTNPTKNSGKKFAVNVTLARSGRGDRDRDRHDDRRRDDGGRRDDRDSYQDRRGGGRGYDSRERGRSCGDRRRGGGGGRNRSSRSRS